MYTSAVAGTLSCNTESSFLFLSLLQSVDLRSRGMRGLLNPEEELQTDEASCKTARRESENLKPLSLARSVGCATSKCGDYSFQAKIPMFIDLSLHA